MHPNGCFYNPAGLGLPGHSFPNDWFCCSLTVSLTSGSTATLCDRKIKFRFFFSLRPGRRKMLAAVETRGDWETNKWWPSQWLPKIFGHQLSSPPPLPLSRSSHNLVVTASSPPLVTEIPPPPPPPPPHQTLTSPSDSSKYPLRICIVWNSKLSNIDRALQEIIFDNSFWRRKTIIENILPSHWRDGRTGSFRNWNLPASALLTSQMFPLFAAPREIQNSF